MVEIVVPSGLLQNIVTTPLCGKNSMDEERKRTPAIKYVIFSLLKIYSEGSKGLCFCPTACIYSLSGDTIIGSILLSPQM